MAPAARTTVRVARLVLALLALATAASAWRHALHAESALRAYRGAPCVAPIRRLDAIEAAKPLASAPHPTRRAGNATLHDARVLVEFRCGHDVIALALSREDAVFRDLRVSVVGADGVTRPAPQGVNCYYSGAVAGEPDSAAAFFACGEGLEGFFRRGAEVFHVSPLVEHLRSDTDEAVAAARRGAHVVLREKLLRRGSAPANASIDSLRWRSASLAELWTPQQHLAHDLSRVSYEVELLMVADRAMYLRYFAGTDADTIAAVTTQCKRVAFLVDQYYRSTGLGIRIVVGQLVLWQTNQAAVTSSISTTLSNFRTFGRAAMAAQPFDAGVLLSASTFDTSFGLAFTTTSMCEAPAQSNMFSVSSDRVDASLGILKGDARNLAWTASIVAHELGHNLGAAHSDEAGCPGDFIMRSSTGAFYQWDACTLGTFAQRLPSALCLQAGGLASAVWCGSGHYAVDGSLNATRCRSCSDSCLQCEGAAESCTKCAPGHSLQDSVCVSLCGLGLFAFALDGSVVPAAASEFGSVCRQCNANGISCPEGFVVDCDPLTGSNAVCREGSLGDARAAGDSSSSGADAVIAGAVVACVVVFAVAVMALVVCHKRRAAGLPVFASIAGTPPPEPQIKSVLRRATVRVGGPSLEAVAPPEAALFGASSRLPPLPRGWTSHVDDTSGTVYYYNAATGESTWERPFA